MIYVPSGRFGSNSYNSFILYNETKRESRKILGYDFYTHLLLLDTSNNSTISWSLLDVYNIRTTDPMFIGTIKNEISLSTCVITSGPDGFFANVLSNCNDYYNNIIIITILYNDM